jgi:deazaflavin-dependent oxidoreductase (nitroreductase family)
MADITTVGRKSGQPRRIEVSFHHFDGQYYISGRPGFKRDWMANLLANPAFALHLKRGVTAEVAAVAERITEPSPRRSILYRILTESWGVEPERARADLDRWVEGAPLVRFEVA